jgi:hypothetical protein
MRSLPRTLLYGLTFTLAFTGARVFSSAPAPADTAFAGLGGAVLVGDGEVFAGEAANQFRPGMVYVYRRATGGWQEVASLTAPAPAVGDRFGSALALDGARLFIGAGPTTVHVFTKQNNVWVFASSVLASEAPAPPPPPAPPAPPAGAAPAPTTPPGARFGAAMAASGQWLLIAQESAGGGRGRGRGGPGAAALPAGSVYAFKADANGKFA